MRRALSEQAALDRIREAAQRARSCAVLTGAGVSAESGVPTFRGEDGLWNGYRAEDLATPEGFARNPERVLAWYEYRRDLLEGVRPNPGHLSLAKAEASFESFTIITQNVDGLHTLAGSRDVVELHGSIHRDRCHVCGTHRQSKGEAGCACGGPWRPDVVWFGEMLPQEALMRALRVAEETELFLVAGTSTLVYPAASLPYAALEAGAFVVEINTTQTPFSRHADVVLRGRTGTWLPKIFVSHTAEAWGSVRGGAFT